MAFHRGEIYFAKLNPVQGREQGGTRPVLIVSSDLVNSLPLVAIVMVGTSGSRIARDYMTNVRVSADLSGLPSETVFLGFQVRSVDASRLSAMPVGRLDGTTMMRIETALRYCLELS